MQLLFPVDGDLGITIQANGVDYTYNYDPDGTWKLENFTALSGTRLWTAPSTADPFDDIKTVKRAMAAKTGSAPAYAVMNTATFDLLCQIDAVKNRFLTIAGMSFGYLTDDQVTAVFRDTVGIIPVVYDKQFKNESKVAAQFVPDGYVSLIPAGALGSTWYGTTPEEADGAEAPMAVAIVNTGVAVSRIVEPHPVNVNTIVSEIVLPSFERADEVAVLKVVA